MRATGIQGGMLTIVLAVGLSGCGQAEKTAAPPQKTNGGNKDKGKTGDKVDLPSAKLRIDTSYISGDFIAAVVVYPARVLKSDFGQKFLGQVTASGKVKEDKIFAGLQDEAGFDPRTLEQAIVLVDFRTVSKAAASLMNTGPPGGGPGPKNERRDDKEPDSCADEEPSAPDGKNGDGPPEKGSINSGPAGSFILRFSKPVDEKAVVKAAAAEEAGPDGVIRHLAKKQPGKAYYSSRAGNSIAFLDGGKTVLMAEEAVLKKMLKAKDAQTPLTKRLASLGAEHDVIVAAAGPGFERSAMLLKGFLKLTMPRPYQDVPDHVGGMKSLALALNLSKDPMLSVVFELADEDSASGLVTIANKRALPQLSQLFEMAKAKAKGGDDLERQLVTIAGELMSGLKIGSESRHAIVSLNRPSSTPQLPKILFDGVQRAREAARRSTHKSNLRQIGIAFHNYHEQFSLFPSHDSNGYPKGQGRKDGLSWRVHLLPHLEQSALYRQFKLDEPWDSPHNKKLISRMPKVFANPSYALDPGKTATHVFVGADGTTPFSIRKGKESVGARFRDFIDGVSNTLMVVEAGPDKAEVWTKPGGLPFDPKENPFDALGRIPDDGFLALYGSGAVRLIPKSTSAKHLRLLLQHADGTDIPDDLRDLPDRKR